MQRRAVLCHRPRRAQRQCRHRPCLAIAAATVFRRSTLELPTTRGRQLWPTNCRNNTSPKQSSHRRRSNDRRENPQSSTRPSDSTRRRGPGRPCCWNWHWSVLPVVAAVAPSSHCWNTASVPRWDARGHAGGSHAHCRQVRRRPGCYVAAAGFGRRQRTHAWAERCRAWPHLCFGHRRYSRMEEEEAAVGEGEVGFPTCLSTLYCLSVGINQVEKYVHGPLLLEQKGNSHLTSHSTNSRKEVVVIVAVVVVNVSNPLEGGGTK